MRLQYAWITNSKVGRVFDFLFSNRSSHLLVLAQALVSLLLLLPAGYSGRPFVYLYLIISWLSLGLRISFGLDGADQMLTIVLCVLGFSSLLPGSIPVAELCLWFLALQLCLAYLTAGIAKIVGAEWRQGLAIPNILGTRSYGRPALASWLQNRHFLTRCATYSVIAFECLFPLVLLFGPLAYFFLAVGLIFHAINAYTMGLNRFLWAFPASYPAILFCSTSAGFHW